MLKALLRLLALPLLLLFIIALPASLVLRNVGNLLFDAETTKTLVRESLMGSELAASLARRGTEQMLSEDGQDTASVFAQISEEEWRVITEIIAPEDLITQTVDELVVAFSAWLNDSEAEIPNLTLDLSGWKENAVQNADQVMTIVFSALPACDAEAVSALAAQGSEGGLLPACSPPEPLYSEMVNRADTVMGRLVEQAPDQVDFSEINQGEQAPAELLQLRDNLVRVRLALGWGWVAVLGIGLVAALMAASGFKSFLFWFGWPVLLGGLLTLALGLSLFIFTFGFIEQGIASALGGGPAGMTVLASAFAGGVLNLVRQPLLWQGALVSAAGISSVLYGRALDRREKTPGIPINRRRIGI